MLNQYIVDGKKENELTLETDEKKQWVKIKQYAAGSKDAFDLVIKMKFFKYTPAGADEATPEHYRIKFNKKSGSMMDW